MEIKDLARLDITEGKIALSEEYAAMTEAEKKRFVEILVGTLLAKFRATKEDIWGRGVNGE